MYRSVQTTEPPIRIYEANYESHTIIGPSGGVDEGSKNEFRGSVSFCFGWDGNEDDGKRHETGVETRLAHCGENFAVAIEDGAENIDNLICHKGMPRFGGTAFQTTLADVSVLGSTRLTSLGGLTHNTPHKRTRLR